MCLLLAGFLRSSLKLGAKDEITLSEELTLAEGFLAIEQVRFGSRLRVSWDIDPAARDCLVPPLLLQPLVENAVGHGIASLVEGGAVGVAARREGAKLTIEVTNPRDPERPRGTGEGVGLANVKARLSTLYPGSSRLEVEDSPDRYRAVLVLPAIEGPSSSPGQARAGDPFDPASNDGQAPAGHSSGSGWRPPAVLENLKSTSAPDRAVR